jgi:hypothetical protein
VIVAVESLRLGSFIGNLAPCRAGGSVGHHITNFVISLASGVLIALNKLFQRRPKVPLQTLFHKYEHFPIWALRLFVISPKEVLS